jgi:hypothetical protein
LLVARAVSRSAKVSLYDVLQEYPLVLKKELLSRDRAAHHVDEAVAIVIQERDDNLLELVVEKAS